LSIGRLLKACGFTETPSTRPFDHIEYTPGTMLSDIAFDFDQGEYPVVVVKNSHRVGLTAAMEAQQFREAVLVKLEPTQGQEPPRGSVNDVLVTQPSAAHWLADRCEELLKDAFPDVVRRPGDMMFNPDALDKLAAAGCVLEDLDNGGVTIHLPATGGSIDGTVIAQMMSPRLEAQDLMRHDIFFPIAKPRNAHDGPDYLKHDPTKRHSRKRPTTKRNKNR
jgi:hypothetical protein